jgi:hypothetical protein
MDVVRRSAAWIEVRRIPHPNSTFAEASDRERELRHQCEHGGSSPQKRAMRVKCFVTHRDVAYGRSCFFASQRLKATVR